MFVMLLQEFSYGSGLQPTQRGAHETECPADTMPARAAKVAMAVAGENMVSNVGE